MSNFTRAIQWFGLGAVSLLYLAGCSASREMDSEASNENSARFETGFIPGPGGSSGGSEGGFINPDGTVSSPTPTPVATTSGDGTTTTSGNETTTSNPDSTTGGSTTNSGEVASNSPTPTPGATTSTGSTGSTDVGGSDSGTIAGGSTGGTDTGTYTPGSGGSTSTGGSTGTVADNSGTTSGSTSGSTSGTTSGSTGSADSTGGGATTGTVSGNDSGSTGTGSTSGGTGGECHADSCRNEWVKLKLNPVCPKKGDLADRLWYDRAAHPVLSIEARLGSQSTDGNLRSFYQPYLAAVGAASFLYTQQIPTKLLYTVDLDAEPLFGPRFPARVQIDYSSLNTAAARGKNKIWVTVYVCDDTNRNGKCSDEPVSQQVSSHPATHQACRFPSAVPVDVWHCR